jgi:hypothetical protein
VVLRATPRSGMGFFARVETRKKPFVSAAA